jgi:UV DNA damage endonuclease
MKIGNFHIGYPCINLSMGISSFGIQKATWEKGGLPVAGEIALKNVKNLQKILEWNHENGIDFYRMSSGIFPWMSEYEFDDLPQIEEIYFYMQECGKIAKNTGQRITCHPGPFTVLASPHHYVRRKARKEIEQHSQMFDMMGFEPSYWNKINIHIGGAYGDKEKAMEQWISSWEKLSDNAKKRLVVENDDKLSMYSAKDLHEGIHKRIGIPITFDSFHHGFCDSGLSVEEAAHLSASTWKDSPPCFHFASSMKLNENSSIKSTAHADWIYEEITDWGTGAWIMVESKAKDLAILSYREMGIGKPDLNLISESLKTAIDKHISQRLSNAE